MVNSYFDLAPVRSERRTDRKKGKKTTWKKNATRLKTGFLPLWRKNFINEAYTGRKNAQDAEIGPIIPDLYRIMESQGFGQEFRGLGRGVPFSPIPCCFFAFFSYRFFSPIDWCGVKIAINYLTAIFDRLLAAALAILKRKIKSSLYPTFDFSRPRT